MTHSQENCANIVDLSKKLARLTDAVSCMFFKPPPPVGAGRGYMFSGRPSVPLSVRACVRASVRPPVRDSRGSFMFLRYLQYLLTDFRQTFVTGASRDRDELIRFWGQKVKLQGHTIAAEAHSTRRYRRVQLFLVSCKSFLRRVPARSCVPCEKLAVT